MQAYSVPTEHPLGSLLDTMLCTAAAALLTASGIFLAAFVAFAATVLIGSTTLVASAGTPGISGIESGKPRGRSLGNWVR